MSCRKSNRKLQLRSEFDYKWHDEEQTCGNWTRYGRRPNHVKGSKKHGDSLPRYLRLLYRRPHENIVPRVGLISPSPCLECNGRIRLDVYGDMVCESCGMIYTDMVYVRFLTWCAHARRLGPIAGNDSRNPMDRNDYRFEQSRNFASSNCMRGTVTKQPIGKELDYNTPIDWAHYAERLDVGPESSSNDCHSELKWVELFPEYSYIFDKTYETSGDWHRQIDRIYENECYLKPVLCYGDGEYIDPFDDDPETQDQALIDDRLAC